MYLLWFYPSGTFCGLLSLSGFYRILTFSRVFFLSRDLRLRLRYYNGMAYPLLHEEIQGTRASDSCCFVVVVSHINSHNQGCGHRAGSSHSDSFFHISTLQLLDKPSSQVSFLLPPGSCIQFLSRIGFSNPTARRFFIECC